MESISLPHRLKRAGVLLEQENGSSRLVVNSKYWSRYHASGNNHKEAFDNYRKSIFEPENWRAVAAELFADLDSYRWLLSDREPESLMALWNDLVDCVMREAYDAPKNEDAIGRVYAYSEWCLAQDTSTADDIAGEFSSCVYICFWEWLPMVPAALEDMPNWISRSEIEEFITDNPFMTDDIEKIRASYELAG